MASGCDYYYELGRLEGERLQVEKEQRENERQVVIKSHLCSAVRQGWQ